MSNWLSSSAYYGLVISLLCYWYGRAINRRFRFALLNPLMLAVIAVILINRVMGISTETFSRSSEILGWLLTPATVCLAIPLYEQLDILRKNRNAVILGVTAGVLTALSSVTLLCWLLRMDHSAFVTLLPKSITTAIGIGISEELGGHVSITAAVIILTGILGNIFAEGACKLFRVTHPVAKGLAIGTSSHVIGTSRAMEMGEVEGAMSSLSIVLAGILTVIGANLFAPLL